MIHIKSNSFTQVWTGFFTRNLRRHDVVTLQSTVVTLMYSIATNEIFWYTNSKLLENLSVTELDISRASVRSLSSILNHLRKVSYHIRQKVAHDELLPVERYTSKIVQQVAATTRKVHSHCVLFLLLNFKTILNFTKFFCTNCILYKLWNWSMPSLYVKGAPSSNWSCSRVRRS